MNLKCIVVDDEMPARKLITEYINKVPGLSFEGDFKNPIEAMAFLGSHAIDVIFLDIQMPGITGLEFIKTLSRKPHIILTTAYSEYALDGYDLDVVDYLMKPISFERFLRAVNKVISQQSKTVITASPAEPEAAEFILVRADGQVHKVFLNDINYIEGLREYVTIFTDTRKIITLESLKNLEENLKKSQFMRVHKSFIVNTGKVESHSSNDLTIKGKKIPIGASYRDDVLKDLF